MIWAGAHVSGHFNPAVTTCFIVFKRIHWLTGIFYILAQILGGLFSAALLKVIVSGDAIDLASKTSINGFPILQNLYGTWYKQLILEIIGTFFLMLTVYMTAVDARAPENVHGIAIGGVVGYMLLVTPGGFATALNPARALCPLILDVNKDSWVILVYIVGPIVGAILAGVLCELFFLKGLEADKGDAVELAVVSGGDGEIELDVGAGGDLTTPMRETGTIDVELDAGLDVDVEVEVDVDADVIAVADLEADFEIEVEVDAGVDLVVWDTTDDTQKASWTGFFMQDGVQNDMNLENMQIGLEGVISGAGSDAVGDFTISGNLDGESNFTFDKAYAEHTVSYKGKLEGTRLAGQWSLGDIEDEFEISLVSNNWNGFFVQEGQKNDMFLNMGVNGGSIFGTGSDEVGAFVLRGKSDGGDFNFVKKYLGQHQVLYFGKVQGGAGSRSVRGKWTIPEAGIEDKFALQES